MDFSDVIRFWFDETDSAKWFSVDPAFDATISEKFATIHRAATRGELFRWRKNALGRLAEIVVLDQFSRNMFRNNPAAFASDTLALVLAQEAVALNIQADLSAAQKAFLFMPFMHSESIVIHDVAVTLFSDPELKWNLEFEFKHRAIIERFGRYPHRNAIVGRVSTAEEVEFLRQPGSSF